MTTPADDSLERARKIDAVCARFEAAWQADPSRPPRVEDYLADDPDSTLAEELRKIEAHYRAAQESGPAPTLPGAQPTLHDPIGVPQAQGPIADHHLLDEVGRGGMGAVYRARDAVFGREVAVKRLLAGLVSHPEAEARFLEEARIAGRLQHPGIVPVYALGRDTAGAPYFTMKLIAGCTLAALLDARDSPGTDLTRFVSIFEQVCQTVAYAHAQGVIHRDLKPSNVMVGEFGEVQVMDWGLAKLLAGAGRQPPVEEEHRPDAPRSPGHDIATQPGRILGTPAYLSPEQARGESADRRADVFGLGAVLCEILTGQPPFAGLSVREALRRSSAGDLGEASQRLQACGADAELVALARVCLAADPAERPGDAVDVAARVVAYRAGVEERLRTAENERAAAQAREVEQRKRQRVQLGLAVALGLLLFGGGAFAWWSERQAAERRTEQALVDAERRFHAARRGDAIRQALRLARDARRRDQFGTALDGLAQATGLLESGGAEELRPEVERVLADTTFARDLDAIRYTKWIWIVTTDGRGRFNDQDTARAYRQEFLARGYDVETEEPGGLAARLRDSEIRAEVLAALDDWAAFETEPTRRSRILAVARGVSPGAWTDRLRDPDAPDGRDRLRDLAADGGEDAPAGAIAALAERMARHGLDPVPLLRAAQGRSPRDFALAFQVAAAARRAGDLRAAVEFYRVARSHRPDNVAALNNLAEALSGLKDHPPAVALGREAVGRAPDFAFLHHNLGKIHADAGDPEAGIAALREALRRDPRHPNTHFNLGVLLWKKDKRAEALAAYREATEIDPRDAQAHYNLGTGLLDAGDAKQARPALELAAQLDPANADAHDNLGSALAALREYPAAVLAHRKAIGLRPEHAAYHYNLGIALWRGGDPEAGLAAFRESIRLDATSPHSHCNAGLILGNLGRFAEAVEALQRGHDLGRRLPNWRAPSDRWLREARRMHELDLRLPRVLEGAEDPATAFEYAEFADLCLRYRRLPAEAVRLSAEAFRSDPGLAADPNNALRYRGACAAVQAGQRQIGLDWLRADLTAWKKIQTSGPADARKTVGVALRYWLQDATLASVREPDGLARLPEPERAAWARFWDEVREAADQR